MAAAIGNKTGFLVLFRRPAGDAARPISVALKQTI
jgi:hypothetical protein